MRSLKKQTKETRNKLLMIWKFVTFQEAAISQLLETTMLGQHIFINYS